MENCNGLLEDYTLALVRTSLGMAILMLASLSAIGRAQELSPGPLALEAAIDWALEHHPALLSGEAAVAARAGASLQASYRPNPTLSFQTENWRAWGAPGFSPGRDLDLFVYASQTIETAGKRAKRVAFAEAGVDLARLARQGLRWSIRQGVKAAYWRALATEQRVKMLAAQRETAERLTEYNQTRVTLGAAAEVDLIKVRLEAERVEMKLAAAEMESTAARVELLRAMGAPSPSAALEIRAEQPPAALAGQVDAQAAVAAALTGRVEIALARARIDQARALLTSQHALAKPDVTPYFGYKRTSSFDTVIGGVSIPLPMFNRNQGGIAQAEAEILGYEADLAVAENRIKAEVVAALETVRQRQQMMTRMETGMLGNAAETARISLAAYQEDAAELIDVLDAQRTFNEVRLMRAEAGFEQIQSWIQLETAIGSADVPFSQPTERAEARRTHSGVSE